MRLSVGFLVLSLQISVAWQAPKIWNEWVSEGLALSDAGEYRTAAQAFRQGLMAAEGSGISRQQLIRIRSYLGSVYANAGQYLEAEREWNSALTSVEKSEGRESLDYALLVTNLALLPTQADNRAEATAIAKRALGTNRMGGSSRDLDSLRGILFNFSRRRTDVARPKLYFWIGRQILVVEGVRPH